MRYLRLSTALVITVFTLGIISGLMSESSSRGRFIEEVVKELRPIIEGLAINPLITTLLIFLNNFRVSLISFLTGPTLVVPLAIIYFNGYVVGAFLNYPSRPLIHNLMLLIPHGVIELPAILLSTSLGTALSLAVIHKYVLRADVSITELLLKYSRYLALIALLLAIAAFIEVFITPLVEVLIG